MNFNDIIFIIGATIYSLGGIYFIIVLIILISLLIYVIFHFSNIKNLIIDILFLYLLLHCYLSFYFNDWVYFFLFIFLVLSMCIYKKENIMFILAKLFHNRINKLSLFFCNLAIMWDVKYSRIFKIKGDILLGNNDYKGAYEAYYNVFCFDNNAESMNDVAVSLEYLEQYEDALKFYNKSLEIEPHNILALNNKSILLIKLKQYDEALSNINKVLEIDENNFCAIENKEKVLNELNN